MKKNEIISVLLHKHKKTNTQHNAVFTVGKMTCLKLSTHK